MTWQASLANHLLLPSAFVEEKTETTSYGSEPSDLSSEAVYKRFFLLDSVHTPVSDEGVIFSVSVFSLGFHGVTLSNKFELQRVIRSCAEKHGAMWTFDRNTAGTVHVSQTVRDSRASAPGLIERRLLRRQQTQTTSLFSGRADEVLRRCSVQSGQSKLSRDCSERETLPAVFS